MQFQAERFQLPQEARGEERGEEKACRNCHTLNNSQRESPPSSKESKGGRRKFGHGN